MIVLDTHAWIWSVVAPRRLSRRARNAIDRAPEIGISTISFWEIALLDARGRIELDRSAGRWVRSALAADPRLSALPVTTEIAVSAGAATGLSDPGDSIIYATAVEHDAPLVTQDERIHGLDPARAMW